MSRCSLTRYGIRFTLTAFLVSGNPCVHAAETTVAVAANFNGPATDIAAAFEAATGHRTVLSFGSTGQLYTQISQGAPFDVYLAADLARPAKAVDQGLAVADTLFTYATGRLVLFSRDETRVRGADTLRVGGFDRIALANPLTAPYGAAAVAVMQSLDVHESLRSKLVQGNNIAQTYQFVETGNAELGFVALSQVVRHNRGSRWIVPESLHPPIAQAAVLLKPGVGNPAARAFLTFLKGQEADRMKRHHGYHSGG